jgi:hypothetical protein
MLRKVSGVKGMVLAGQRECDYPPIVDEMRLCEYAGQEEFSAQWRPPYRRPHCHWIGS